jgi:hypothetical protein
MYGRIDMIVFELSIILGAMFVVAGLGFIVFARKFYTLRDIVYVSIKDMGELIVLLALFDKVENKEEKLARMLKMSEDEVRREIESWNWSAKRHVKFSKTLKTAYQKSEH